MFVSAYVCACASPVIGSVDGVCLLAIQYRQLAKL